MIATARRRELLPQVALGVLVLLFVAHALWLACVAEDAYISFRFSRNLAEGHGLVWNVGEPPVEGYTNFLWVVLCSVAIRLGIAPEVFTQALGLLSGALTLLVVHALGRRALGLDSGTALVPCCFLALSGPFAAWATSGMETSLFTLLVTAALYFLFRSRRGLAYALLALATLTRPEGALCFAVVAIADVASWRSAGLLQGARAPVLAYVLPCGAYFLWRVRYFGFLLPNTFYAKTGGGAAQYERGAIYTAFFALHFLLPLALACIPAVLSRTARERVPQGGRAFPLTVLIALVVTWIAYVVWVGGDYMAMYRFFVPILPALYLGAGLAFAVTPRVRLVAPLLVAALALTVLQSTPLEGKLFSKPPLQHGTYRGIETERWHVARLRLLGRFFDRLAREEGGTSLATQPIGIVGWSTSMKIYGFHGLVDPAIAHGTRTVQPIGQGLAGHEKQDPSRALSHAPTYVMFTRALTRAPLEAPSYDPETDARIRREYVLRSVRLDDRENGESGTFTYLEKRRELR